MLYTGDDDNDDDESTGQSYGPFHFLTLFLVVGAVVVVTYVCMHNRKKVCMCVYVHACVYVCVCAHVCVCDILSYWTGFASALSLEETVAGI